MEITGEPFHKVGRQSAIITAPSPKIILDKSFNYGKYVEDYFHDTLEVRKGNYQGYFEGLENLDLEKSFYSKSTTKEADTKLKEIDDKYCHEIYVLQHQYESAYQKGVADKINEEITRAMQIITSDYLTQIETLKDTYELDTLSDEQNNLLQEIKNAQTRTIENSKNQIKQIQDKKQNESLNRIKSYKEGTLKLSELTPYDIRAMDHYSQIDKSIVFAVRKLIERSNIPNFDDYTLGQLYSMIPSNTPKPGDGSKTI